jgi:hypothetical protein
MATSFDSSLGSSSGHDTRVWTYSETKNHKLEVSPFYIKSTLKMYVKYTRVKSITSDFTLVYFAYIFNIFFMYKGEISNLWFLVSVHVHILVLWPDDYLSLGLKLVAN